MLIGAKSILQNQTPELPYGKEEEDRQTVSKIETVCRLKAIEVTESWKWDLVEPLAENGEEQTKSFGDHGPVDNPEDDTAADVPGPRFQSGFHSELLR